MFRVWVVLIETLWNVKSVNAVLHDGVNFVLIETLWNVKKIGTDYNFEEISINRNIVECKVKKQYRLSDASPVLIETLWNVKKNLLIIDAKPAFRINRNIVECKVNYSPTLLPIHTRINRNIVECKVSKAVLTVNQT